MIINEMKIDVDVDCGRRRIMISFLISFEMFYPLCD